MGSQESTKRNRNWQREAGRVPGATRYQLLVDDNPFRKGHGSRGEETQWRWSRWPLLVEYDNRPGNIATVRSLTEGRASSSFFAACNQRGILRLHVDTPGARSEAMEIAEGLSSASSDLQSENYFDAHSIEDDRSRKLREIVQRRGQPAFRKALLKAYKHRCQLTGCDAIEALEAAHIQPYLGERSNVVSNGLLLRADIHTLFDLGLIGVNPDGFECSVSVEIERTCYQELQGRRLALPARRADWPAAAALDVRWKRFCGLA